jgi:dethiobiotin synthetase
VAVLLVTGTNAAVGKTVVTAAVAAAVGASGASVAVLKPAQTGARPGRESDVDTVRRLAAPAHARSLAEYSEQLPPLAAARATGKPPVALDDVLLAVEELDAEHDLVVIEGTGGLLVPMGDGWTTADLAQQLGGLALVVAPPELGAINHTALTLEALSHRGCPAYVVIGAWPVAPDAVHRMVLADLPGTRVGVVPDGAVGWPPERFRRAAPSWFAPGFAAAVTVEP